MVIKAEGKIHEKSLERSFFEKAKLVVTGRSAYQNASSSYKKIALVIDGLKASAQTLYTMVQGPGCDCENCTDLNNKHTAFVVIDRVVRLSEYIEARARKYNRAAVIDLEGYRAFRILHSEAKSLSKQLNAKKVSMNDYVAGILQLEKRQKMIIHETNMKIGQVLASKPGNFKATASTLSSMDIN